MEKIRYELDPYNRFVSAPLRSVLDGVFRLEGNNELTYHIKSPVPRVPRGTRGTSIPHQLKLKGTWSLTDNHDLRLTLDKSSREAFSDQLTLKGEILDVGANSLLFAVTTKTGKKRTVTHVLDFQGVWQADENNRLTFSVKKETGVSDILTFDGIWETNKNHEIIYRYEKAQLKRKLKKIHTLVFRGHWDIRESLRLSYALDGNNASVFNFSAGAGIFKDDYIKYEVGITLSRKARPVRQKIVINGAWKIKKDAGLLFKVEYGEGKLGAIQFGAEAKLTDKDTILFKLRNDLENKDIGGELELRRDIFKGDGELFLKLLKSAKETAVYVGGALSW